MNWAIRPCSFDHTYASAFLRITHVAVLTVPAVRRGRLGRIRTRTPWKFISFGRVQVPLWISRQTVVPKISKSLRCEQQREVLAFAKVPVSQHQSTFAQWMYFRYVLASCRMSTRLSPWKHSRNRPASNAGFIVVAADGRHLGATSRGLPIHCAHSLARRQ